MGILTSLPEYVAASDCKHPLHPGRLSPEDLEHFTSYFGSKTAEFFGAPSIYYAGTEDGMHVFTNKESWYIFKQLKQ